ncbi:MAG: hypothetical protein M3R36_03570 [Bacteroidota bacterium]|nr:hypothetical protein [Bacteroidota bacterium]
MPLHKFYIFKLSLLTILISFFLSPSNVIPQNKYDFDFNSQWGWEDLINKVVIINPSLIKSVNDLKNKISNIEARIIFKMLSELDSLKHLSELSSNAISDFGRAGLIRDSILSGLLDTMYFDEDLSGLISAALRLSEIKAKNNKNIFEFENRVYLPQPIRDYKNNIEIKFDYSGVETILKYFNNDTNSIKEIFESAPYKIIFNDKSLNGISKSNLKYYLAESSKNSSLFSIYKWVNPGSFWNMGGTSVYKKEIENVTNILKQNDRNIKLDIEKLLSEYLSDSIFLNAEVMFMLGKKSPGWLWENNKLIINLEYFGDDFDYLVRFIRHYLFMITQKEIQLSVDALVVKDKDRIFVKVLSNILENGAANYIGPIGTETRPSYLLEKDFTLFNKTFKNIYKKNNYSKSDSMISEGYSGDAPFYTMATQMAYIIETTLGKKSLIESIRFGPIFFFSRYIQAYKENTDRIRKVFTFSEKLENKITEMKILFPDDIVKDALKIKKFRKDPAVLNQSINKFLDKYKSGSQTLPDLLSAQLFLEAGEYSKAKDLFIKGISNRNNEGELAGEIAESFLKNNSLPEALYFYNLYIRDSPEDWNAYTLRGEYFFKTGDNESARNDFDKALVINSNLHIAKEYLKKINSK